MLTLTPRAATELKDLIASQENPNAALRVWVAGASCSGYQYGIALDDNAAEEGDEVSEQFGVRVYVDQISLGYLEGASVDFIEAPNGGGFKIENPNAPEGGCSCGSGGGGCGGSGGCGSHNH